MQTPTTTPQGFHLGRPRAFMRNAPWDGQQYHGSGASFTEIPMSEVDNPKVTTITPAHRPRNPSGMTTFPSGAVRGCDADGERYDLITPVGLRRLAETCAEGAAKYGDHNWLKGIPLSQMLNHGIRHLYLYLHGDATEDHLAHAAWNILGAMHFEEQMPEMIGIPTRRQPKKSDRRRKA